MNRIFLLCFFSILYIGLTPLYAGSKLVQSIGVGVGGCLPQGGWNPGFTAGVQANMGEAIKYLYFSPYLSFSQAVKSEEINNQDERLSIQYLALGVKMVGYINSKPRGFYLGGGLSYNLIAYDTIEWGQLVQNTQISTYNTEKLGFTVLAGYLFILKTISIFIEADYMFTAGGYNHLRVDTGVYFNL
jgi:opacity protein-like surface antigen